MERASSEAMVTGRSRRLVDGSVVGSRGSGKSMVQTWRDAMPVERAGRDGTVFDYELASRRQGE